jgi:hypothetical protein
MALAKGLGLGVLKPFGESGRYDVTVENGGPIWRVQGSKVKIPTRRKARAGAPAPHYFKINVRTWTDRSVRPTRVLLDDGSFFAQTN